MSKISTFSNKFQKKGRTDGCANAGPLGGQGGRKKASLVKITKNSSLIDFKGLFVPLEDGSAQPVIRSQNELQPVISPEQSRATRWALKSVVNEIMPSSRTEKCMRRQAPMPGHGLAKIGVKVQKETCKAFYTGLMACGSVWTCPVCAAKVSERRRNELRDALNIARQFGYQVNFVTLTNPHGIGDDLKEMRDKQKKALNKMSSGRSSVKSQLANLNIESFGYIRATEITHGLNGWHPHFHIILFTSKCEFDTIKEIYLPKWQSSCEAVGLPRPSDEHGCDVQDGSKAADYAAKWGLEDEMTKANTKLTRKKGKSPWGLLRCVLDANDEDYSPERATNLFRVYARCMKGSRQLHWSVGLRKLLVMAEEITDEQLVLLETEDPSVLLTTIAPDTWKIIRHFKYEAHILSAAEATYKNKVNLLLPVIENLISRFRNSRSSATNRGKGA